MSLPTAPQGDLTLAIARDPYRTISRTAERLGVDAFRGKLLLAEAVFLTGRDMAERFYAPDMIRSGATPAFAKATLFGRGGVQGLDGDAHVRRKAMFLRILSPGAIATLCNRIEAELDTLAEARPKRLITLTR